MGFVFLLLLKSALQLFIFIFLCLDVGARQSASVQRCTCVCQVPQAGLELAAAWAGGGKGVQGSPCPPAQTLQVPAARSPLPKVSAEQSWEGTAAAHR